MAPPLDHPETCDRCGTKTRRPALAPGGEMLCPKCKAEWVREQAQADTVTTSMGG